MTSATLRHFLMTSLLPWKRISLESKNLLGTLKLFSSTFLIEFRISYRSVALPGCDFEHASTTLGSVFRRSLQPISVNPSSAASSRGVFPLFSPI
jgi:hypothetical protein